MTETFAFIWFQSLKTAFGMAAIPVALWNAIRRLDVHRGIACGKRYFFRRINQLADRGSWRASAWLLERRAPGQF